MKALRFTEELVVDRTTSHTSAEEFELPKRLQSGDPKAIEALYTMYFDRIYDFVLPSVKWDKAAAEDIVQNIFMSVLSSAESFKGHSKIYTWLAGIAHHKIVDYYRREQREPHHNNGLTKNCAVDSLSIVDHSQDIPGSLESGEMSEVCARALSSLPLDYRQVLLFKYVDEMTVLEISQVMNRSPKSIEGLITRARKLFKENLFLNREGKQYLATTNK